MKKSFHYSTQNKQYLSFLLPHKTRNFFHPGPTQKKHPQSWQQSTPSQDKQKEVVIFYHGNNNKMDEK